MNDTPTTPLPFHELQQKILPELHLLAAQSGIENYRKLKKDALAFAIMERQAQTMERSAFYLGVLYRAAVLWFVLVGLGVVTALMLLVSR